MAPIMSNVLLDSEKIRDYVMNVAKNLTFVTHLSKRKLFGLFEVLFFPYTITWAFGSSASMNPNLGSTITSVLNHIHVLNFILLNPISLLEIYLVFL